MGRRYQLTSQTLPSCKSEARCSDLENKQDFETKQYKKNEINDSRHGFLNLAKRHGSLGKTKEKADSLRLSVQ